MFSSEPDPTFLHVLRAIEAYLLGPSAFQGCYIPMKHPFSVQSLFRDILTKLH